MIRSSKQFLWFFLTINVFWFVGSSLELQAGLFEKTTTKQTTSKLNVEFSGDVNSQWWQNENFFTKGETVGIQNQFNFGLKTKVSRLGKGVCFVNFNHQHLEVDDNFAASFKECYVTQRYYGLDVSLGYQLVFWGQSDGVNPTDIISPYRYRFIRLDQHSDRIAPFMFRFKGYAANIDTEFLVIPFHRPFEVNTSLVEFADWLKYQDKPIGNYQKANVAGRIKIISPYVDASISGYHGYTNHLLFTGKPLNETTWLISPASYLISMGGADMVINMGKANLKFEGAYFYTHGPVQWHLIKQPRHIDGALSLDIDINSNLFILQGSGKWVDIDPVFDPSMYLPMETFLYQTNRSISQSDKEYQFFIFSQWTSKWYREKWDSQLSAFYSIDNKSVLALSKIGFKITDNLKTEVAFQRLIMNKKNDQIDILSAYTDGLVWGMTAFF